MAIWMSVMKSCHLQQANKEIELCNRGYTPVLCRGRRGRLKLAQKSSRIAYGKEREATSEIRLRRFSYKMYSIPEANSLI